jgi:hypothetical protein
MLEPFDALIGTWVTEATHPLVDEVVPGTITGRPKGDLPALRLGLGSP